jgi:hypothetical protein
MHFANFTDRKRIPQGFSGGDVYETHASILNYKPLLQLWMALIVDYTMTNIANIRLTKIV